MRCWSVQLRAICLVSVAAVAGCGGERRSGAAPAGDTAVVSGSDTAAVRAADTTTAPAPDTMARHDTAAAPPVARPTTAKKTPPKPAAQKPPAQSQPARPESSTAAAPQPADTPATSAQTEAGAPLRDAYHTAPLDTVSQEVYTGWKQFNLNCARCHGEDVQGTTIAPHLIVSLRPDGPINTKELFVQTVCAGRPAKGMPAWCALGLDMEKINQIYAYVKGRSDSKIHPGRPAVKAGG
jgi:mono/diheme cytochrome c family protein